MIMKSGSNGILSSKTQQRGPHAPSTTPQSGLPIFTLSALRIRRLVALGKSTYEYFLGLSALHTSSLWNLLQVFHTSVQPDDFLKEICDM